mgnify:CR=1 FL=1
MKIFDSIFMSLFTIGSLRGGAKAWMSRIVRSSRSVTSSSTRWLSSAHGSVTVNSDNASTSKRLFPQDLNIIYDSKCNVCKLEIDFLRNRDLRYNKGQPRLKFTDWEGETGPYNPQDPVNGGIDYATGMAAMKGVTASGEVYTGVPVFRRAYQAVGLGWLFAITTWPGVSWIADRLYDLFAKYRTRLTRGATVERLVEAYQAKRVLQQEQQSTACDTGACDVKK